MKGRGGIKNQRGLRTFLGRTCLLLRTGRVAEEVSELGGNNVFMLIESLGVEPHQARLRHVLEQDEPVVLGNIFPVGVMLPVLAKQMIEVALPLVATKVKAKPFFEGALLG
jgi:hypothetical protein